jgi:hypothetical protein
MKVRPLATLALLLLLLTTASGCGDVLNDGPTITSLTVSPSSVVQTDTGMTDEFFTITLSFSGFESDVIVDETRVFIQDPEIDAVPGTADLNGDTITLGMIAKTWVGGLAPGVYEIGAEVRSETESVTERNLATIEITE